MEVKEVILGTPDCETLGNIDDSIRMRSIELGVAVLRIDALKEQLAGLYESRRGFVNSKIEAAGYEISRVVNVQLIPEGEGLKLAIALNPVQDKPTENSHSVQ
jgi:hypothetical protein